MEKIGGEPESRAVGLLISGVKENLKECELEILELETRYGFSFDVFKEKVASGELGNEFSYELEKDCMRWDDLLIEKKLDRGDKEDRKNLWMTVLCNEPSREVFL